MAIYYARKSGNINATDVWATTPSGVAGDYFPSFTNQDTLVSNSFTVTINVNTTILEVRRDTTGGATAGGFFSLNPGLIFNGNINGNGNIASGFFTVNLSTNQTATINGNITGGSANGTEIGLSFTGTGGTITINGNIIGGTNSPSVVCSNSTGIINIIGNICSDSNGSIGIQISNNNTVNITGNISSGGLAGGTGFGLYMTGAGCIVNVTGNIVGNARSSYNAIRLGAGTLNITGNVGPAINESQGLIFITANTTLVVTGNVYGGNITSNTAIANNSPCTITIVGLCIGGNLGIALNNSSTATAIITRAKGNGFGPGSVGMNSIVGVAAGQTSVTKVYEIEYGDLGQSPTSGPIEMVTANSNVAVFAVRLSTKKTLVDLNNATNLVPASGNVRSGTSYNYGNNTGSCVIPNANSVVYGVPVDNVIGSGLLSPVAVWNVLTSAIGTSGTIGERLKNCSTVSTVGKQLEGVL